MTAAPLTSAAATGGDSSRRPSTTPNVVGLDPSLTSTGLATPSGTFAIVPRPGVVGLDRIRHITGAVLAYCSHAQTPLVVVEDFIPGKAQAGVHERGGLWWRLVDELNAIGYPIATIKPQGVKLYATGKGNANKDAVLLAAARRFSWFEGGNDEADALWLSAIGCELMLRPIVDMPARNRQALEKVERIKAARP